MTEFDLQNYEFVAKLLVETKWERLELAGLGYCWICAHTRRRLGRMRIGGEPLKKLFSQPIIHTELLCYEHAVSTTIDSLRFNLKELEERGFLRE